jgi:hypothetical protein
MWASLISAISGSMQQRSRSKINRRNAEDKALESGPSWRYRRRLIHGAYLLGFAMVVFGAFTVFTTSQVGVEMIIGGVSLIAIIVTAYTTSATYEDVRIWNHNPRIRFGESNPEDSYDTNNPDGI